MKMSIKSQKSLNDECSEIFEKSYSVRSASDDSSICSDEEDSLARSLLRRLCPRALAALRRRFRTARAHKPSARVDRRMEEVMRSAAAEEGIVFAATAPGGRDTLWLDEAGLLTAVAAVFGNNKYSPHAHKLFQQLDLFSTGRVWWSQLVDKLVETGVRRTASREDSWQPMREEGIKNLKHCKRETIVKLVEIEKPSSYCVVAVSRGGRVGVYAGGLRRLNTYEIFYHRTGVQKRYKNRWITDALYMSDVQTLAFSASDRSLTLYDAATLTHTPSYCFTGLPDIPTCLSYSASSSELAVGSAAGDVWRMRFLQPAAALAPLAAHVPHCHHWSELSSPPHSWYIRLRGGRRHARAVCRVRLAARAVWSADRSRLMRDSDGRGDASYEMPGGITCFAICQSPAIVVAGGRSGVYMWDSGAHAGMRPEGWNEGWRSVWTERKRQSESEIQDHPDQVERGDEVNSEKKDVFKGNRDKWQHRDGKDSGHKTGRRKKRERLNEGLTHASLTVPGQAPVVDVAVLPALEVVVVYCNNCMVYIWDVNEECLLQTLKLRFPVLGVSGRRVEFGAYSIHPGPPRIPDTDEDEDESQELLEVPPTSRRPSSVFQGSTGGLMLQPEIEDDEGEQEDSNDSTRFDRPELLLTCCDAVCVVRVRRVTGRAPPPPADCLSARTPAHWTLPDELLPASGRPPPARPTPPPPRPVDPAPVTTDLDTLLDNAGLKGILEKDFVLMQGLKHDLNKKIAEMEAHKENFQRAVSACAPYLALRVYPPAPLSPADEMLPRYQEVMRLFPGPSIAPTPTGSGTSTPRHNKQKLQ